MSMTTGVAQNHAHSLPNPAYSHNHPLNGYPGGGNKIFVQSGSYPPPTPPASLYTEFEQCGTCHGYVPTSHITAHYAYHQTQDSLVNQLIARVMELSADVAHRQRALPLEGTLP